MSRRLLSPQVAGRAGKFILPARQIGDVGSVGQNRAGRVLTLADFTTGLGITPRALWNLDSSFTDISGGGFTLTNTGVTNTLGITGTANEAADFNAGTTTTLTAVNSLKQGYGSWGCWFRCSRRTIAAYQAVMSMYRISTAFAFELSIGTNNVLSVSVSTGGADTAYWTVISNTDVGDGRWHFVTWTWDGSNIGLYLDGRMDVFGASTVGAPTLGPMYTTDATMLFALGNHAINTANPFGGQIDEAFVTDSVLDEDMHRFLYCNKVPHGLNGASKVYFNVQRRKRTGSLAASDFTGQGLAQPLVGYNFFGSIGGDDFGSLSKGLSNTGAVAATPDVDGQKVGGAGFNGTNQSLSGTDTGLPATTSSRTIGVWFRTKSISASNMILLSYGTNTSWRELAIIGGAGNGYLGMIDGASTRASDAFACDGLWHFACIVDDNTATDGHRIKLYMDGKLVSSTSSLTGPTLKGASGFFIGCNTDSLLFFNGQIGCVFICGYAMTTRQMAVIYNKSGLAAFGTRSPLDEGPFVERLDDANAYCVFDELNGTDLVEMAVIV